jgi:hypothetical protein
MVQQRAAGNASHPVKKEEEEEAGKSWRVCVLRPLYGKLMAGWLYML